MERSLLYRGIDEEAANHLALVLNQAGDELRAHRTAITAILQPLGILSPIPAAIAAVEEWTTEQAADIRVRATHLGHDVGPITFHRDALSGLHLHGFIGIGLGYRHLGHEYRTTTDTYDCGDGLI